MSGTETGIDDQKLRMSIAELKIREIKGILHHVSGTDYQVSSIDTFAKSIYVEVEETAEVIRRQFEMGIVDGLTLQAHMESLNCSLDWAKRLKESSLNDAPWWVAPLIAESAKQMNVARCTRHQLVVFLDQSYGLHVYPHVGPQPFRQPVFGCPTEFDYNPILAGALLHEVGHLWYRSCPTSNNTSQIGHGQSAIQTEIWSRNREEIQAAVDALVGRASNGVGSSIFDQFEYKRRLDEFRRIFSSHLEELMCDEIARRVGGPSFDVALALMFSSRTPNDVSESHPSDLFRLRRSKEYLETFCAQCEALDAQVGKCIRRGLGNVFSLLDTQITHSHSHNSKDNKTAILSEELASRFLSQWVEEAREDSNAIGQSHWCATTPFDTAHFVKNYTRALRQVDLLLPLFEIIPKKEDLDRDFEGAWGTAALTAPQILAYYSALRFDPMLEELFGKAKYVEDGETARAHDATLQHLKAAVDISDSTVRAYDRFVDENRGSLSSNDFQVVRLRGEIESRDQGKDASSGDDLKIVMTPILCPSKQARAGSLDLRLGTTFLQLKSEIVGTVDPYYWSRQEESQLPSQRFRRIYRSIGQKFLLHPHEFVLATVLEYVFVPKGYFANVLGRSSWGRMGLTIATATAVSPWYRGRLTLELKNVGTSPIALVVGSRVAQLYFTELGADLTSPYIGKYLGPVDAEAPPLERDSDWPLLRHIAPFSSDEA